MVVIDRIWWLNRLTMSGCHRPDVIGGQIDYEWLSMS